MVSNCWTCSQAVGYYRYTPHVQKLSASVEVLLFLGPCWDHLVVLLLFVLRRTLVVIRLVHAVVLRAAIRQPRVHQQLGRFQSLSRHLPQHAADETLCLRRQATGQAERPAADLGKQRSWLRVLERVSSDQHGVQRHAQAPDVCGAARIGPVPVGEQLWADVGRTAVSVFEKVVAEVTVQNDAVVEAQQGQTSSADKKKYGTDLSLFIFLCRMHNNNNNISNVSSDCILPVLVHKDESSQLQVSQDDPLVMAVRHRVQHLSEQTSRLFLIQPLPATHVRVHVTVVIGQEDVQVVRTNHHVLQGADVVVFADAVVGL